MNGYYEWQKQQAKEQIQARSQEAENHRLAKQVDGRSSLHTFIKQDLRAVADVPPSHHWYGQETDQSNCVNPIKIAVPILIGVIMSIFLMTG